jgi:hypothetical protein
MPNPVAVNDLSPISGSLQTSRISYGVETAGKNYGQNYNSATWYSDIPNNGQFYTIISDNYTANYYVSRSNAEGAYVEGGLPAVDEYSAPVFWMTAGTSSLDVITIVNGLPDRRGQIPFNSGSQALNWIASSSNYFAVGPDYYAQIDADQLRLFYHANQVISYPTTMSTWYDLSGYTNPNGTLTNGPVWNSNGWITFDGTNDVVYTTPWALNNEFSYEGTFYINPSDSDYSGFFGNMYSPLGYSYNGSGWIVRLEPGGALEVYLRNDTAGGTRTILINNFRSTYSGKWFNLAFVSSGSTNTLYVNNTAYNGSAYTVGLISSSAELLIGAYDWGGRVETYYLNGANEYTRAYSKALSAAEVAQNYYGGPIVTDGLVFALDIDNLVSHPKSGTTVYDLTGNYSITATNSTYEKTPDGVPAWRFTGNNSRLTVVNYNVADSSNTYEGWFKINSIGTTEGKSNGWNTLFDSGTERPLIGFFNGAGYVYPQGYGGAFSITSGVWFHIATVFVSDNDVTVFLNGQKVVANSNWGYTQRTGTFDFWIGGDTSTESMDGWVSNCRFYNRALTDSEVLQNYNATK